VPRENDASGDAWESNAAHAWSVREVLQRRLVRVHAGADVVGQVEPLGPLLLVEGHRETAVDRHAALLAELE